MRARKGSSIYQQAAGNGCCRRSRKQLCLRDCCLGQGLSLWDYFLQGRRRLRAAGEGPEPPSHSCLLKQLSDLDDWGWRMLCSRGVWQDGAQQAEASISFCNTVQIHASVSPATRRLSSRFEQSKSNSFPWELLPSKEEGRQASQATVLAGALLGLR